MAYHAVRLHAIAALKDSFQAQREKVRRGEFDLPPNRDASATPAKIKNDNFAKARAADPRGDPRRSPLGQRSAKNRRCLGPPDPGRECPVSNPRRELQEP